MAGSIGEVQLDALPYSDQGYEEPGVREMVSFKKGNSKHVYILIFWGRHLEWLKMRLNDIGQLKIIWSTFQSRRERMK